MKTTYFRATDDQDRDLKEIAAREHLTQSDVIRKAVRLYLASEHRGANEPTPQEMVGAWFATLPLDVRRGLYRIGEALRRRGPHPLDDVVLPAWADTAFGTEPEEGRRRRKSKVPDRRGETR